MSSTFKEPGFVFISYSHKNSALVKPIIEVMTAIGINVWYDNGIEAGSEWARVIQRKIRDCSVFIPFLSPEYEKSTNCYTEINYATKLDKDVLSVKMQPTPLARGLSLLLSHRQIVDRTDLGKYPNDADFIQALLSADILDSCKFPGSAVSEEKSSELIMSCAGKLSYVDETERKKNIDTGIIEDASVIGSESKTDARWKDKNVRSDVDSSAYPYLHFRCKLKEQSEIPTSKRVKVRISTLSGTVVHEKEEIIEIPSKTKHITLPVSFVEAPLEKGKYSATISVDLINAFYLEFTINNDQHEFYSSTEIKKETRKRVEWVNLFVLYIIQLSVLSVLRESLSYSTNDYTTNMLKTGFCLLICLIVSETIRWRSVRRIGVGFLFSFILVYILSPIYFIYVAINAIKNFKTYIADNEALKKFKKHKR